MRGLRGVVVSLGKGIVRYGGKVLGRNWVVLESRGVGVCDVKVGGKERWFKESLTGEVCVF